MVKPRHAPWRRAVLRARTLPLAQASRDNWLVIAPHPDDEALGAGVLIASLAQRGATLKPKASA